MPTLYKYAQGQNVALTGLTLSDPQPFSRMMQTPERRPTISRFTRVEGENVVYWDYSGLTLEQLDTLMAGMGLTFAAPSALVTIYTKKNTATAGVQDYVRCNAMATAPKPGETMKAEPLDNNHWQECRFTFNILDELVEP